ncbi:MAG TPA: penicillin-binding protein 2, partial [Firmicutes bacterium]|nr:penicillin-binding protein 2 [Bacillota bacterium]
ITIRLIDIQVIRSDRFAQRAAGQQERQVILDARRGRISDRNGVDLAVSLPATSVSINPRKVRRATGLARQISAITGEPSDAILRRINRNDRSFAWVARNIEPEVAERIRALDPDAMMLLSGTRRVHPLAGLSGQLLGHVDIDNVGGDGIELLYNDALSGRSGWIRTLVDARGDRVPNTAAPIQQAVNGGNVALTIDADYQAIVEHELSLAIEATGATSGQAILLEASTGAVRAMANVPLFNPDVYRAVDPSVRRNRVISDPYEPGSTFKIVTASAVLSEQVITPTDSIDCLNGSIEITGQRIRDTHPNGKIPFREVFSRSSNVGTIIAAQRLSSDDYYRYIRRFGFGAETGVGLPGESKGILAPTTRWSGRSHATIAIGQEIGVTALQMASAYAALANDGWLMRPYVVDRVLAHDGSVAQHATPLRVRQVVPESVAHQMVEMLTSVVDEGTGKTARIAGLRVAGKTGTAQIARADGRGYEIGAYTASFAGFLPDMEPRLVCV